MRKIYDEEYAKMLAQYNAMKDTGRIACKAAKAMRKVITDQEFLMTFGTLDKDFIAENQHMMYEERD